MAIRRGSLAAWSALTCAVLAGSLQGCASSEPTAEEAREAERVNQVQLQEDVERFSGLLLNRVSQATETVLAATKEPEPLLRTQVLSLSLRYQASVLDIATGPYPELNMLDMLAFVELCQGVLEEHWIPDVFGEAGRPLVTAFDQSTQDLEQIALGILTPEQIEEVHGLVRAWREENPGQWRVEGVRLFEFSETAGRVASQRDRDAQGLLSTVRAATKTVDEAQLLAERGMFLVQRMPFVLMLGARVGALQLGDDSLLRVGQIDEELREAVELRRLMTDASALATLSVEAIDHTRALVDVLEPLLQPLSEGQEPLRAEQLLATTNHVVDDSRALVRELDGVERALASAERVTGRAEQLLRETRDLLPPDGQGDPLSAAGRWLDAHVRRWLLYEAVVVVLLMVFFWGGYVVAKRLAQPSGRGRWPGGARPGTDEPVAGRRPAQVAQRC